MLPWLYRIASIVFDLVILYSFAMEKITWKEMVIFFACSYILDIKADVLEIRRKVVD